MKLKCPTCGKEFDGVGPQRYCSAECKAKARLDREYPRTFKRCLWCGKEFRPTRSDQGCCSAECAWNAHHWGNPENAKRVCPICGKTFMVTRATPKYCSEECRTIAAKATKSAADKRYKDRKRYSGNREKVITRDMRQCAMCGATENLVSHDAGEDGAANLVVHHLDESGSSPKRNDSPGNLVTLCRACHAKVHTEQTHGWRKGVVVTVKCAHCGREFTTPKHRIDADRGKYCSRECAYKAKLSRWVTITCQHCGKEFTVLPSRARRGKAKYCSMVCRKAAGYASRD